MMDLEGRGKTYFPAKDIIRVTCYSDGTVEVVEGDPAKGLPPRTHKFKGKEAKYIKDQIRKQTGEWDDLRSKQAQTGRRAL
jgi:hypothetical protein